MSFANASLFNAVFTYLFMTFDSYSYCIRGNDVSDMAAEESLDIEMNASSALYTDVKHIVKN